ncbi:MAG: hypothetical protein LBT45_02570 [Rickettsiales bacterium]|nr:hypothetical protein [Rickettsiales bacterium]
MIFALVFLTPVCGFAIDVEAIKATISKSSGIGEAQQAYMTGVEQMSDEAGVSGKVKRGVIDAVLKKAKENSQKTYSAEEIAELKDKAKEAKEKEQSTENKMLGGLTMAATGIGGMQLMQGMAEKKADEAAAADMAAYLDTIRCGISGEFQGVKYNEVGKTPPETRELMDARLEYTVIAKKMRTAKENLGLPPGIESELIVDTTKGLYDDAGTDTDGISHHFETGTERAASDSGKKRMIAGGVVAGVGVVGGVVGNALINKKDDGDESGKSDNGSKNSDSGSKSGSSGGGLGGLASKATSMLGSGGGGGLGAIGGLLGK